MSGLPPRVAAGRVEPTEGATLPIYRLTPPGELVEADSLREEGRTVALIGTALLMNRPRDIVIRRVPSSVVIEVVDDGAGLE